MKRIVGYQGVPGAYSSIAAREYFPSLPSIGFSTFDDVIAALRGGSIACALLPIENSTSGRVADIHHLLPGSGLSIIGEHFLPVRHCLIGIKGTQKKNITHVYSHREALAQCKKYIRSIHAEPVPYGDTAGAVEFILRQNEPTYGALASAYAAELNPGTSILDRDVQDDKSNVTRFLVLTKGRARRMNASEAVITSIVFKTRDIPAALFKSLTGFATTATNIIKLESFVPMSRHVDAHFYLEFEGSPDSYPCSVGIDEMRFYTKDLEILGTYKKSEYRKKFIGPAKK